MGARAATHRPSRRAPAEGRRPARFAVAARWIVLGIVVVLAGLVAGGYGLGWRWTGLSGSVTLWDWLQVLALPVALGTAPIVLSRRRRLTARHRAVLLAAATVFALLVVLGYLVPLTWTGFTGNTLWDWLELVLLPLVVATASLWPSATAIQRRHLAIGLAVVAVFVVLVAAGYLVPWRWTGFQGNTAWDWVKLLLVPVLLPTALLPLVNQRLRDRLDRAVDRYAEGSRESGRRAQTPSGSLPDRSSGLGLGPVVVVEQSRDQ